MTRRALRGVSLVLFAAVFGIARPAGAQSSWTQVTALAPESKATVERVDGRAITGRIVASSTDSITVANRDGTHRVERSDVRRLSVPSPTKRLLWGAIGVAAGALTPIAACPSCANEGRSIGGAQAGGAALGSLLFLLPQSRTVYKGPR